MGRPAAGYKTSDGQVVPGVTTIVSECDGGKTGGLVHWAWKLGKEGQDYRAVRDSAATVGHYAHALIESWIKRKAGKPAEVPATEGLTEQQIEQANEAYSAFSRWVEMTQLDIIAAEIVLVSDDLRFGGTVDAIVRSGDVPAVLDFKSGSGVYSSAVFQVAAYRHLVTRYLDEPVRECHILRIDRDTAVFSHHHLPERVIDRAWEGFRHMRTLYDIHRELRRVV